MSEIALNLTHSGFKNLIGLPLEDDFTFDTGSKKYAVPRVVAAFFSPAVSHLIKSDPLVDVFHITDYDDQFQHIYKMMKGETVTIEDNSVDMLAYIADQLANQELVSILQRDNSNNHFRNETILVRIKRRNYLSLDLSHEFKYLAENINEFDVKDIVDLGPRVLSEYFAYLPDQADPHTVYNIVIEAIKQFSNQEACILFRFINFMSLSTELILSFLDLVQPEQISKEVWISLSKRLVDERKPEPEFKPLENALPI